MTALHADASLDRSGGGLHFAAGLAALVDAPVRATNRPARLDGGLIADLLEELDTGIIVCDETGHVALANDCARRELARGGLLALDANGLVSLPCSAALAQWHAALRAAIHAHRRQLVPLRDREQTLMVSVMPLGAGSQAWALVLLGRRQPAPELAVEMLGKLHALTHAERGVLVGLLNGRGVGGVARERGVKISTLRTQVASLRAKLGVRRMEDLLRLVAELPPMASVLRSPALKQLG